MDISQLLSIAIAFLGIFLLLMIYTYISKLENMGCACSESKYRTFIKNFPLFAILYFILTMMLSPSAMIKLFGTAGSFVYVILRAVFFVLFFVFFVLVIIYVRGLVKTKCECSEDIRREIMYIYAILEVVLLSLSVVFVLLESIVQGAYAIGLNSTKSMSKDSDKVVSIVENPVKAIRNVPKDLKHISKSFKSVGKTLGKLNGQKKNNTKK